VIKTIKKNKAIVFVFFICFVYWAYLFFYSSMDIVSDAVGFERLGAIIYKEGWAEFLRGGPNREPFYPLSIAASMYLGDLLNTTYQKIQTIFQIILLFLVQILTLKIMAMCSFKKLTKALAILYLGFSPAIVNAGFSLYSEILAMPFVLLIIIFSVQFWKETQVIRNKHIVLTSICLSLAFIGAICVKAIFQYICYFLMLIFLMGGILALLQNRKEVLKRIVPGILIVFFLVGGFVYGYKYMNKIYNGNFDFTDRYDVLLFGTAYKRVQPLSKDVWAAHFASIPGNNFCTSVVNKEACLYPQFHYGDATWSRILPPLLGGVSQEKASAKIIQLSFEEIKKNPIQYFFLTSLESLKMSFWESTRIGFVNYPESLNQLFQNKLFKNGIRLMAALLTYAGVFFIFIRLLTSKGELTDFIRGDSSTHILFFIFCIIISFAGLYSIFAILTRFALPIAPLYIIGIAYFFDTMIFQSAQN